MNRRDRAPFQFTIMNYNPEQLLELALKAGASHAEVYQSESQSHPVFFEANRLKQLESSQSLGTALRLWREGCPGLAVAYGQVEPETIVSKAIALSQLNAPETIELTESRTDIHRAATLEIPVAELVTLGQDAIAQLCHTDSDLICSGEFSCETSSTKLINSQGLNCQYTDNAVSYYFGVQLVRGEDFLEVYDGDYLTLKTANIDQIQIEPIIKQILQRLEWANINTEAPVGKIPVLFTNNAATMFWGTVSAALSGKCKREGSSPWTDLQGQIVTSNQITLSQQPDRDPYICPFDDEGTPTQHLSLIKEGRLEQFYCDRTTARLLGTTSTGNGFRPSLGRYPTPGLVNMIIEPGQGTFTDLIAQLDNAIIVDQILGDVKDISGEFSINIDLGYRIKNGNIVGRIKDTMVAGNVYHALKNIITLGADQRWNGSCYTPSLIIDDLSVIS